MNREDEIGGLWSRTSQAGNEFMSGHLKLPDGSELEVVVFPNRFKKPGEATPDWRVYRSQPLERSEQRQAPPGLPPIGATQFRGPRQPGGMSQRAERSRDELDDDLPF